MKFDDTKYGVGSSKNAMGSVTAKEYKVQR